MDKKANKPSIRFAGFTDAWEQRKLGGLGQTYNGLSGKTKEDFGHGEASFITYMNVFSNPISDTQMVEPIEVDVSQNEVSIGDVFFTTSSETPEEVGMSSVLLEKRGTTYLNSFCFGYRLVKKVDLHYLAYMLRSYRVRKRITFLAQGISRYNISKNKVMEIEIPLPSLQEQELIGIYFRDLDDLITLHQRKHDKLVNIKKSMLEKMFPQHGADVPEIRFSGFTDSWKRRKVGDVVAEVERPITMKDEGVYQLVTVRRRNEGVVSRGFLRGKDILVKNYFMIHEGDYLISKRQVIHGANGYVPKELDYAVVSNEYMVAVSNEFVLSKFWVLMSKRREMYRMFLLSSYGVDIEKMVFNVEDWKKRFVMIPSMFEQNRIISWFEHLDTLITLHQRKLEKLQNIKKSCLEKMFV